ncbi:unnamed protein product [Porites lobata]|uniref:Uncharacterized protein n=1 Tax=Porites lobata TaxID=104759 RepID=A0ABN8S551_9CNID|nr:unnamed protein product [Porites lobata]
MNSNRSPKQWSLTKNETITTFEAWRQNLQYFLSLDVNFAPFLAHNFRWLKKSSTAPNIGLEPDGDDVPTTRRRTAFQKNLHLDLMLGQIANFCTDRTFLSRSRFMSTFDDEDPDYMNYSPPLFTAEHEHSLFTSERSVSRRVSTKVTLLRSLLQALPSSAHPRHRCGN